MTTKPNRLTVSYSWSLADTKMVYLILRDTITVEDPYINLARAKALAIRTGEPYAAQPVKRTIKDHLIKTNITI